MNEWYYAHQNQRLGPVSGAQVQQLVAQGVIQARTPMWRKGMANWQIYASLCGQPAPVAAADSAPASRQPEPAQASPISAAPEQAATPLPVANNVKKGVMELGEETITEDNKDLYVQRLLEGVDDEVGKGWEYAGFWVRFAAALIDGILFTLINIGAAIVVNLVLLRVLGPNGLGGLLATLILYIVVPFGYWIYTVGSSAQATPGKRMLGLRVIRGDGRDVTYLTAWARMLAQYASMLSFMLGYIWAAFDREKRSFHDRICDTRIIRTS